MTNLYIKNFIAVLACLLVRSITVPAQVELPQLPADPAVKMGTLRSGVTYYMVHTPEEKGYAHVAVVQENEMLPDARLDALDTDFFSRMGIAPGPEGFVSEVDGNTIYRFSDVPFYKGDVLDSTLLFAFARVAESRARQAVIVCGDIDAVELKKKMDIFSMLVPRMPSHEIDDSYVWTPTSVPVVDVTTEGRSRVAVTYASARIPRELMNTAQAVVTRQFGAEIRQLLRHRLSRNLSDEGIDGYYIGMDARRSESHGGDERHTVYVEVPKEQLTLAMKVMARTLGELDDFGVSTAEFSDVKQVLLPGMHRAAAVTPSAREYVERCMGHFLYGAHLATGAETLRYFSRKNVADSVETRLFNRYAQALWGRLDNFTLAITGAPDSLDTDELLFDYNLHYLYGSVVASGKDYSWHSADTAALHVSPSKVKLKSERAEPVSGGVLWTFSNGMRVVYKQVKGSGYFSYALQLNGGLSQVQGLSEGEGAYIGALLPLYNVAGLAPGTFQDMLLANGISMQTHVELNSMDISGSAPSDKLSLLLKAFLAIANRRTPNADAFRAFRAKQQLQGPSLEGTLFQALNPGYAYSPYVSARVPSDDVRTKAHKFFEDRFSRVNDGVLILSGDIPEEGVKKMLMKYLGGFRTLRGSVVRHPVEMHTLSGVSALTGTGAPGFYVLMDTEMSMTAGHFYTAQVALDALRMSLARHLAGYGVKAGVELRYCVQPQERFQVLILCPGAPLEALPSVRAAIADAAAEESSTSDIKAWKQKLDAHVRQVLATPEGIVSSLLARYSANKDITSRYAESIADIDGEQVQSFLKALSEGGRIEYITHE